jgi:hypothetical protein
MASGWRGHAPVQYYGAFDAAGAPTRELRGHQLDDVSPDEDLGAGREWWQMPNVQFETMGSPPPGRSAREDQRMLPPWLGS